MLICLMWTRLQTPMLLVDMDHANCSRKHLCTKHVRVLFCPACRLMQQKAVGAKQRKVHSFHARCPRTACIAPIIRCQRLKRPKATVVCRQSHRDIRRKLLVHCRWTCFIKGWLVLRVMGDALNEYMQDTGGAKDSQNVADVGALRATRATTSRTFGTATRSRRWWRSFCRTYLSIAWPCFIIQAVFGFQCWSFHFRCRSRRWNTERWNVDNGESVFRCVCGSDIILWCGYLRWSPTGGCCTK